MTKRIPIVDTRALVSDVERLLLRHTRNYETISYVYVVDRAQKLHGVVSVKEVFRRPKSTTVASIMKRQLITALPQTHQERVALLALHHHIKAIPIVDRRMKLLGVVSSDMILHILHRESVEDILRFGGVFHPKTAFDDVLKIPLFTSLKHRLPWLVLGLFGGLLTATILGQFETLLSQNLILAAFIPLIVYMASAVATQMEAMIIRDLAINPRLPFLHYFLHQFLIVALIGGVTSILLYVLLIPFQSNETIRLVLGISMFFAILSSVMTGVIVPYLFGKIKLDPANASGPIGTIIQDLLSVIVYFGAASWLL